MALWKRISGGCGCHDPVRPALPWSVGVAAASPGPPGRNQVIWAARFPKFPPKYVSACAATNIAYRITGRWRLGRQNMTTRTERLALGLLLLIFACFTWRGLIMFYSGDDMMNMYGAWMLKPWTLAKAQILFWMPVYRPVGGAIYRVFYALFGISSRAPLRFLLADAARQRGACMACFRVLSSTVPEALIALSLTLVHGTFQDLYLSAGTIYDRLWFLFTAAGLIVYARFRTRAFLPVCLLCILCMGSKESGVALPVLLLCYQPLYHFPEARKSKAIGAWLRNITPLFVITGRDFSDLRLRQGPSNA